MMPALASASRSLRGVSGPGLMTHAIRIAGHHHGLEVLTAAMLEVIAMTLVITSPAFTHEGPIPRVYTCQGKDISPALAWSGVPAGTREGTNDWKRTGYGGPCPPIGRHRYFHELYALHVVLPDLRQRTKAQLEQAMKGHVLAQPVVMETYQEE